ncbi:hypothetical protein ACHWQZ_G010174 [Mnemiopsis leidyi]
MAVLLVAPLLLATALSLDVPCAEYLIVERWNNGWKGNLNIPIPKDTISWKIDASFDNKIMAGDFWAGQKFWSRDKLSVRVLGNDWSAKQTAGQVFKTGFTVNYDEHGPDVNFKTLEITLCWADGTGCETCSPLEEEPKECSGGFQGGESGEEGAKTGKVQIMSKECYSTMPDITLVFSKYVERIEVGKNFSAICTGNECLVSREEKVGINELIEVDLKYPALTKVVGILFTGQELCDVVPEEVDLSLDPTLAPATTSAPITTTEPDPFRGCADYEIVETWRNGWKGHLHIPIKKDTSKWRLDAEFNKPVVADFWAGLPERWSNGNTKVIVPGLDWSATQRAGTIFKTGFTANHKEGDNVFIKWMKLKLCWKAGGCMTCDIVKEECSNPRISFDQPKNNQLEHDPKVLSGVFAKEVKECSNDMPPTEIEFSSRVKRLIVGRGRYRAACSEYKCTITTIKPMKMVAGTQLKIKFKAIFWNKPGKLVGLTYGEENVCHG